MGGREREGERGRERGREHLNRALENEDDSLPRIAADTCSLDNFIIKWAIYKTT